MYQFPIGIMLNSLRMENRQAIETAAKMGAKGVQLYATRGENSPRELVGEKRKELLNMMKTNGLCFAVTWEKAFGVRSAILC